MDWGLLISAFSAAGLGSVVGSAYTQAKDRREARAKFIEALGDVEMARWAATKRVDLRAAIQNMRSRALLAGIPSGITSQYVALVHVSARESRENWVESEGEFNGVAIGLGDAVAEAARVLLSAAWHPVLSRPSIWIRQRRVARQIASFDAEQLRRLRFHASRF